MQDKLLRLIKKTKGICIWFLDIVFIYIINESFSNLHDSVSVLGGQLSE